MHQTQNLGLTEFETTDKFRISHSENSFNKNMEILDEEIGAHAAAILTLGNGKKGVQSPVSSPVASGSSFSFIDNISQNAQGVIVPTKKNMSVANNLTTATAGAAALDAHQGKVIDDRMTAMQDGVAIIANGNTHSAIANGQFVYVKNHGSLAEGMYKATAAIATNGTLSTSNLTADPSGGLNDLQAQVSTLNSNVNTNVNINSLFTVGPNEDGGPTGRKCGKLVLFNFIGKSRTHTERDVLFTVSPEIRPVTDLKFPASIGGVTVILNLSASTGECTIFLINGQESVTSRLYCTFTYICF